MTTNRTTRSKKLLIEAVVRDYFKRYAVATYQGRVTTGEVLDKVRNVIIKRGGLLFTTGDEGEAYDFIRDLGPVGEDDAAWLRIWGGSGLPTTASTGTLAWPSEEEWGLIA